MTTLLILLATFALLPLLLAVPLELAFRIEGIRDFRGQISVQWLFGAVRFRIPVPSASRKQSKARVKQQPSKQTAVRNRRGTRSGFVAALRQAQFRQRVLRFFKDVVHAVDLQRLRLLMRLGLGDPADTGRLWGLVGPLSAMAQNISNADVRIQPEFMDSVLEVQADGKVRLIPLQFLVLAIAFVLSPPSIRAWCTLRGNNA